MKTYVREARNAWPNAEWITGNGRFASVSLCPPAPTVMLFETQTEADIARKRIDKTACGGACTGKHAVIDLDTRKIIT